MQVTSAEEELDSFFIARDGSRAQILTENRTNAFLKQSVPGGIKDGKIVWDEIDPPSKPYAWQKSIKLAGGLVVTSTLYMKNCHRIISVSEKNAPEIQRIIFYQHSYWSGDGIESDEATEGVKMAIDKRNKSFIHISSIEGKLKVNLPNAQQDGAGQSATDSQSKSPDN